MKKAIMQRIRSMTVTSKQVIMTTLQDRTLRVNLEQPMEMICTAHSRQGMTSRRASAGIVREGGIEGTDAAVKRLDDGRMIG